MSGKFSMDDYIDVAERIATFNAKYPDGSLQTIDWSVENVGEQIFIVYRAAAYRTANDRRPGHGIAWEPFPGPTQYTRNSELMNAETAAWGRAIVALGLSANRKIASKQEVRARAEEQKPPARVDPIDHGTVDAIEAAVKGLGWNVGAVRVRLVDVGAPDVSDVKAAIRSLSKAQGNQLWKLIEAAMQERPAAA